MAVERDVSRDVTAGRIQDVEGIRQHRRMVSVAGDERTAGDDRTASVTTSQSGRRGSRGSVWLLLLIAPCATEGRGLAGRPLLAYCRIDRDAAGALMAWSGAEL
jgi:hypothetical protein